MLNDAYLVQAAAYLLLNPVRAHLVERPEEWRWSSCAAMAGLAPVASWLDLDWLRAHPGRLQAVTTAAVADAAAEFLAPARFTGVVVGDGEHLSGPLAALGGVDLP